MTVIKKMGGYSRYSSVLCQKEVDEARATCQYVFDTFAPIRPFINIVEAEQALIPLFHRYGIPLPPDIQRVMMNLQRASTGNHLPAFQRRSVRSSGQCGWFGENSRGDRMRDGRRGRRYRGGRCGETGGMSNW